MLYSGFPPVLVVDDVPMIVEVMLAVLGQLGFRDIDTASDGAAALTRRAITVIRSLLACRS